ncbi:MAG: molybdopterin cofactor-binding domain-containing protein [Acidobacteriota bacterium]
MPELDFTLNGRPTTASYDEGMSLLEVLRTACGVTAAKNGCSQGFCGSCTVLIDGRPALACQKKPEHVVGRELTTLEGLPEKERELLARAFVREGAIQCGFCTPGIMMRTYALLRRGKGRDRAAVARALNAHLCRCTGYLRIFDAVATAAEAWDNGGTLASGPPRRGDVFGERYGRTVPRHEGCCGRHEQGVGAAAPRYRGLDHALGRKPYVADMGMPAMLHAALVLAPHPRARVLAIDPTAALAMPGAVRVITAADVPGERHVGLVVKDWPVLVAVGETTRCVGDVLAVVVADGQFHARRAAAAVRVEVEALEPVTDPVAALAPGAPAIHPGGNLLERCAFSRGDVDAALVAAAHVVTERFTTERVEHAFLEPEACLALPLPPVDPRQSTVDRTSAGPATGESRELSTVNCRPGGWGVKVFSQGQGVHDDQAQIAAVLGVPRERVEVELVTNGGAFGGKEDLSVQAHTALAAFLLERPVRCVLTREQSILIHPKRHPMTMDYTVACDAEGRLTAVRARIVGDTGAYASVGGKVLERAAGHSCGPYRVPNVDVEAQAVYTNNPPSGAMRGFGANQAAFAIEGMLDRLATKVGVDRYDIRERNLLRPGDRFATGQIMAASCGALATLEAVRDVFKSSRHVGIACGIKNTGIGNGVADIGRVVLRVTPGGRVEVVTGFTEMGQGLFTILRQVIAHETGLDPEVMDVVARSEPATLSGMTTASRATALATEATRRAAVELAVGLDGRVLADLAGREYRGEYICDFTVAPGAPVDNPITHMTFGYATQVVVLDEAGRIVRVVAAHDVGRAVNPLACAQQIEGAVHMGLGHALSEGLPCTGGVPDSLRLRDLGIVRAQDMPEVDVILLEVRDEVGGYGAKGVGEIGLVPTAAAVASALSAYDGIARSALPMREAAARAFGRGGSRAGER